MDMIAAPTLGDSLELWLQYLEGLHPRGIDLGLDRVGAVYAALGSPRPAPVCITVGGTNGKGSTVALLSGMLQQAGYRVGRYTSPHLLRYNERLHVGDEESADAAWVQAFARIEQARGEISLSYFEFGTLAAFLLLAEAGLDAAILEVGLGGRLDAVNLIDADVAILTSVGLDHQEYLGNTREQIGWDKAHIFRAGRPAVIAALDLPASVIEVAKQIGAAIHVLPEIEPVQGQHWRCPLPDGGSIELPAPLLQAPHQTRNACAAVWAWILLGQRLPFSAQAAARGIAQTQLTGRLQRLSAAVETWVDVAHNGEAAASLAAWLRGQPQKPTVAIFAALADKDLAAIVDPLAQAFAAWIVLDLRPRSPRAADPLAQSRALRSLLPATVAVESADTLAKARARAETMASERGRILIFGSFITVAAALA
ncbi:MAG: bifunctional folylpolyglutamate synthase/dihydrofolate synthase [Rhodoferax sp.]|nr:bifunctional folylpolyglutamate synthase/dihydrofolate synthase [Rhodoferax sp.]